MDERKVLLLLLALTGAACAELPESQSASPREERIYRTGSNIPMHDRNSKGEVLTLDPESVRDVLGRGQRMPAPSGSR